MLNICTARQLVAGMRVRLRSKISIMVNSHALSQTASNRNLRRLFWLRMLMAVLIGLAASVAILIYDIALSPVVLIGAVMLLLALNGFTWWRLGRPLPVTDMEILVQLLLDTTILTGLFYATGGYTNPFVWMYLLPLTVAAVALPWRHTWLIAALAVICYTGLMFWYDPLPMMQMDMSGMSTEHMHMMHMQHSSGFSVHLLGMWAGFVVSAGIIAYFVARIGNNLREYDHLIAQAREKALESERMLALGTLSTAAAHELGTPLATMAVVAGEMAQECAAQPQLAESLALLRSQISRCKEILTSITASAGQQRAEAGHGQPLDTFLQQTVARWQDMRPATQLDCRLLGAAPAPVIAVDRTLGQALVNLLDNAADASPQHIECSANWTATELDLAIRDFGPGLTPEAADKAGTPFFTTKQDSGLGLGLYLARLIFERFGGTLSLSNHSQGGAVTQVRLPLKALLV
jgi:two-component system, sensor histidine kinase RegB